VATESVSLSNSQAKFIADIGRLHFLT